MRKKLRMEPAPLGRKATPVKRTESLYWDWIKRAVVDITVTNVANATPPKRTDAKMLKLERQRKGSKIVLSDGGRVIFDGCEFWEASEHDLMKQIKGC